MDKFSSCCGVPMNGQYQYFQRCPSCNESCDAVGEEIEPIEYVLIEMEKFKWDAIRYDYQIINDIDFKLKEVKIKDDFFKDDTYRNEWKKKLDKEYKLLRKYEHEKRYK